MTVIFDSPVVGQWVANDYPLLGPVTETTTPRQGPGTSLNVAEGFSPYGDFISAGSYSVVPADNNAFTGDGVVQGHQHLDFHYRLWFFPAILQLSNPQLNTDIPFVIWNTWTDPETISSVNVAGSSVLSFDIGPGTVLRDSEYRTANMQIGSGEPTIDAQVQFITENLDDILQVLAAISSTFNLIPDVPVTERWNFLTDILTNYKGVEQRIALRRYPRIDQEFSVQIIDLRQRREQFDLLRRNITVRSLVPLYQYSTVVTGVTPIGGNKIFFDPSRTNMRVGQFMAVVNTSNELAVLGEITQIDPDGAVISSVVPVEVDTRTWFAMPCLNCIIDDGSGIRMNNVTGQLKIKASTFNEPTLLRPDATRTVQTFDGIPLLDRRPLIPAEEDFQYRREVIDSVTGQRDLNSSDLHPTITGNRTFVIQRIADPDEMDYWRSFFDTIRGAQKGFLLSTYFPDLTLESSQLPLTQGASQFIVNEGTFPSQFGQYGAWEHIQIEYEDTIDITQHTLTSQTTNADGTALLGFNPPLPDDPDYVNIKRISFLQRCRATDSVVFKHFANYSEVSFGIYTTDE